MSKLPILSSFPIHSLDDVDDDTSGCSSPPFHSSASVPFKWEEKPGKPIPCTALIPFTEPISLKLIPPPRMSWIESKVTKTPSPTTVLYGPFEEISSPERGLLGPMVMMMSSREQKSVKKVGRMRLFGSWSWGKTSGKVVGKTDGFGDSFVFPSSVSCGFDDGRECCSEYGGESECAGEQMKKKSNKIKKSKSFLSFTQVMQWKGSKLKKGGAST
ncbi:unnamed protein product [Rhodiola kirilowii]